MSQTKNHLRLAGLALLAGAVLLPRPGNAFTPAPADLSRAVAVAQSGIANAETKLKAYFPFRAFDSLTAPQPYKFWGADRSETAEPPAGALLENAISPSFAVEVDGDPANADPAARLLTIGGQSRGYSGIDGPGTYAANGDQYALRVSDLSGRIFVNDGLEGGASGSVSQNLKRILNVLGQVVSEPGLGDRILAGRPAGGYATLSDLVPALGSEASYLKVRDFLTAHAWVDRNVANPVPLSPASQSRYPVNYYRGAGAGVYRFGSSMDVNGHEIAPAAGYETIPTGGDPAPTQGGNVTVFGLDSVAAQWIEIVGRAPVNVNTARREVLIALLSNLQGFYITERKRNNLRWQGGFYFAFTLQNRFAPGTGGSEYGYLVETYPIAAPGGVGIPAALIADEILACRKRQASPYVNYATKPWSGPFRTWTQFNLFVDALVEAGALNDPRPIHKAYEEEAVDQTGYGNLVPDPTATAQAARAIGDVLKANFNPNLHLNELNPDANLYLLVDKTDLIVNSTEFCFVPTGYFEVESLGRVLRPANGQTDALTASNNSLMAQAKVDAVLKLYDLYRETTQKQFYGGSLPAQVSVLGTNSNSALEIGPEPDNGVFPGNLGAAGAPDNEWDGYVALSTLGGVWHGRAPKAKNTLTTTMSAGPAPQLGAAMHAHFTLDSDLCDHPFDRSEIAGRTLADEEVSNWPDRVQGVGPLPYGGPYDPTKGDHRLAKSFRLGNGAPPALKPFVSSDLRIDGLYAERHSAPAYYMHKGGNHFWNFSTENAHGMVSFWIKPSFFPELTGKVRKFWDMSRYHDPCAAAVNVSPFELEFMPAHYRPDLSETVGPKYWYNNMGKFEPCSMYFGSKQWHQDSIFTSGSAHEFGKITSCLNHLGHAGEASKPSPMQGHKWMNLTFSWGLNGNPNPAGDLSRLYINGTQTYTKYSSFTMTAFTDYGDRMNGFEKHAGGAYNHMRLGGTSRIADAAVQAATGAYKGNYSSDATIDELYVWKDDATVTFDQQWAAGRYYNPRKNTGGATFTSQTISLPPAPSSKVKVLGASWTWYGEDADPATGERRLWSYSGGTDGMPVSDLQPRVRFSLQDAGLLYGPLADDGFSPVLGSGGTTPAIANPSTLHYQINFWNNAGTEASAQLATPVLDDVTIYWTNGAASTRVDTTVPLMISSPDASVLPDAPYAAAYAETFTASAPAVWSVTGGALPRGLTLDSSTGELSGSPTQGGTFSFVVTATAGSNSASAPYTLTVTGAPAGTGDGGGHGGGGCGLVGLEAAILLILLWRRR